MLKFIRPIVSGLFISSPFILYGNDEALHPLARFKVYAQSDITTSKPFGERPQIGVTDFTKPTESNPGPIRLAQRLENGKLLINMKDLNEVLDKVGKSDVAVYAICGPSRTGKSFLLTRCVEHLLSTGAKPDSGFFPSIFKTTSTESTVEKKACRQFEWNNRAQPLTSGIWIWSEPLKMQLPNGKKVYVLLVDCQGCFDEGTSINEDANIFAFSTLFSSVQIFNIKHQLDESTIQFLELFTGIARRIKLTCLTSADKSIDYSFQKLTILVRDFHLKGYDYGYHNANGPTKNPNYKVDKLDPNRHQPATHQRERSNIITSFHECGVFLLPHPGKSFTASDDQKDLDKDYLDIEKGLLDVLFNPENIVVKSVNGVKQNGSSLKTHVKRWVTEMEISQLPELPRTTAAVIEMQLLQAIEGANHKYESAMETFLRKSEYRIDEEQLLKKHQESLEESLLTFDKHLVLFGGSDETKRFQEAVLHEVEKTYRNIRNENLVKPVYHWYSVIGMKTITVLATAFGVLAKFYLG